MNVVQRILCITCPQCVYLYKMEYNTKKIEWKKMKRRGGRAWPTVFTAPAGPAPARGCCTPLDGWSGVRQVYRASACQIGFASGKPSLRRYQDRTSVAPPSNGNC